ncbi:hypothetical protein CC86DRAFT_383413 [Ophiobolus disseminans]|uniref:Uncharacterized protein n=1 Tax=Ophiobolus disseminans TaxID=1469910 RepID=A0A6A6ZW92_9PLEO|nr:hypothetical protein CC86DRAFT_383413 [Ophiobolus disseminans]
MVIGNNWGKPYTCMVQHGDTSDQFKARDVHLNPELGYDFAERLKNTHIPIRAEKIEVSVQDMDCSCWGYTHRNGQDCSQIIGDVIRGKLEAPLRSNNSGAGAFDSENAQMTDVDEVTANLADMATLPLIDLDEEYDEFVPRFISDEQAGVVRIFSLSQFD